MRLFDILAVARHGEAQATGMTPRLGLHSGCTPQRWAGAEAE
jgi:hypothetical protein